MWWHTLPFPIILAPHVATCPQYTWRSRGDIIQAFMPCFSYFLILDMTSYITHVHRSLSSTHIHCISMELTVHLTDDKLVPFLKSSCSLYIPSRQSRHFKNHPGNLSILIKYSSVFRSLYVFDSGEFCIPMTLSTL